MYNISACSCLFVDRKGRIIMHKHHALWLGLPLLLIVIFALSQAWLPGRISGAAILLAIIVALAIIFVLRFRKTFQD